MRARLSSPRLWGCRRFRLMLIFMRGLMRMYWRPTRWYLWASLPHPPIRPLSCIERKAIGNESLVSNKAIVDWVMGRESADGGTFSFCWMNNNQILRLTSSIHRRWRTGSGKSWDVKRLALQSPPATIPSSWFHQTLMSLHRIYCPVYKSRYRIALWWFDTRRGRGWIDFCRPLCINEPDSLPILISSPRKSNCNITIHYECRRGATVQKEVGGGRVVGWSGVEAYWRGAIKTGAARFPCIPFPFIDDGENQGRGKTRRCRNGQRRALHSNKSQHDGRVIALFCKW